jgi:hypothetical protein
VSLIDEALRKASDQAAGRDATPIQPSSWVPAYGLDRRSRRRRATVLVAGLVALAAAGGVYWLTMRAPSERGVRNPRISWPPPSQVTPFPEVLVAPPPRAAPTRRRNPSPTATQANNPVTPRETNRPTPSKPTGRSGAPSAPATSQPPTPQVPARPLADGRTYKGEVSLPGGGKISLDGIAYSEPRPVAVINGRVLETGGMAEDFTVERIEPDRVTLSGRGMTIFLELK